MNVRSSFSRTLAVALALALSQAFAAAAQAAGAHLVDARQVAGRLAEDKAARQARVELLQAALDVPQAHAQAGLMGLDMGRLRAAVPHLSDAELRDLSGRASQVKDLAAGSHDDGLVIVGVVLLLAGLAVLVAVAGDEYYDDCYCY